MHVLRWLVITFAYCVSTLHLNGQDIAKICDAIYVINLDRSLDRLEKMSSQLNKLGIKFIRFKAFDGSKLKILNMKTGKIEDAKSFTINKKFKNNMEYMISLRDFFVRYKTNSKICNRYLSYGEIGCAMSHLNIMYDIVKNNFKRAIIFEDDIVFEKNFKNDLVLTLANTPNDFDVMFLDVGINAYHVDLERPFNESRHIANPARLLRSFKQIFNNKYLVTVSEKNNLWGTHAYCISLKGAKKIISNYNPIMTPIDEHIFHNPVMNNAKTKRYIARKKMLYISDSLSLIGEMGRNVSITQNSLIVKNK